MDIPNIENRPGCVEAATKILGDKWTPMLIRALAPGPMRFCELQKETGGVNPRTLSARLTTLERRDIILKNVQPTSPPYAEYSLTSKGNDLLPILQSMAQWGERYGPETKHEH